MMILIPGPESSSDFFLILSQSSIALANSGGKLHWIFFLSSLKDLVMVTCSTAINAQAYRRTSIPHPFQSLSIAWLEIYSPSVSYVCPALLFSFPFIDTLNWIILLRWVFGLLLGKGIAGDKERAGLNHPRQCSELTPGSMLNRGGGQRAIEGPER